MIYNDDLDPSLVQIHIFQKTTVEYNNQINEAESVSGLVQGISGVLSNALQTLEQATPLIEPESYLSYIQNLLKDIDPSTESLINEDTIKQYIEFLNQNFRHNENSLDSVKIIQRR